MDTYLPLIIFALLFCGVGITTYWLVLIGQEWFNEYEDVYTSKTQKVLEELFIFQNAKKLFWTNLSIALILCVISGLVFKDISLMILSAAAGFFGPKFLIWKAKQNRNDKFASQFVDGLLVLGNALRAGLNLTQAIEVMEKETLPPLSQEFGLVVRENRLGLPIEEALVGMTKRIDNDDLKLMVISVNIIYSMGGNLIEIFESLASVIRERTKLEGKTKSLTAQGKIQGIVVGLLPTGLGGMMFILDPTLMGPMFGSTIGNIALAAMVILQITGYLILQKITRIEI
jgi:tight adherence protein B